MSPQVPATADAVCPFCGLLCDDLALRPAAQGAAQVLGVRCGLAAASYARACAGGGPRLRGVACALDEAVAAAARLLGRARQPLIGGLSTDVAGMRAAMRLAQRCGAAIDHMNAPAKFRNLLALQDGGWITTTLGEIKHRADLIVLAGTDVVGRYPRFFERFVWTRETLFGLDPGSREIVYLGAGLDTRAGIAPDGRAPRHLACDVVRIGEAFAVLRALLGGRSLQAGEAAGVPLAQWADLARRMRAARYGVVVWAAPDFDFPHAELAVRALCELVKDLNAHTRFAGLPLGGSEGDFTADAVSLWQTGYPFRSRLGADGPAYDPWRFDTARMFESGEADALLWIASIDPGRVPPPAAAPTVLLGAAAMRPACEPEVFIPVGTPGLDHAGHLFRADKVVALHLQAQRARGLPSVAEVVGRIEAALAAGTPC
jgi:formylmethanofuran dehydrogenase subunit B